MAPSQTPAGASLLLMIKFTTSSSTSLPDLPLPISSPSTTSTLRLKQLIRPHLPSPESSARLRLISAGKVLNDTTSLSASLNLPPPPPSARHARHPSLSKGKGKAPETPQTRVYIHCSISAPLSPSDLHTEAASASTADAALSRPAPKPTLHTGSSGRVDALRSGASTTTDDDDEIAAGDGAATATTTPAPVGFDRLLATGFSASEVAQLRAQFLANLSFTHTPDTMPSGAALRRLEDRWLDSGAQDGGGGAGGAAAAGGAPGEGEAGGGAGAWGAGPEEGASGMDDYLWGNVVGFFWPLGAAAWGLREEGVWTRRRQISVFTGVMLNLVFGFLRMTS
jgi:hypothetical protein